ncbi:hypothetical protein Golax_011020, partial [Gossypium laxum]|nr:hypothetical protein [Gossypium laxum]
MENDIVGLTIQNEEENAWQISSNGDDPVLNFVDVVKVVNGSLWTFNNHLLVFHRLVKGEDRSSSHCVLLNFGCKFMIFTMAFSWSKWRNNSGNFQALPRRVLAPISAWLRDEGNRVEETQSDAPGPKDAMDEMGLMHEERPLQLVNGNKRAKVLSSVSIVSIDLDLGQTLNNDESADSA